jgi:hypothetical protein
MAPAVARLLAAELDKNQAWQENQCRDFRAVAANFVPQ